MSSLESAARWVAHEVSVDKRYPAGGATAVAGVPDPCKPLPREVSATLEWGRRLPWLKLTVKTQRWHSHLSLGWWRRGAGFRRSFGQFWAVVGPVGLLVSYRSVALLVKSLDEFRQVMGTPVVTGAVKAVLPLVSMLQIRSAEPEAG